MDDAAQRRRVVEWADPAEARGAARGMTGLEYMRAMRDGALPRGPVGALLGMETTEVEPGRVVMRLPVGEHLMNPGGIAHGGLLTTLLDSVLFCAVYTTLPQGRGCTTLEIKVNFLRAVTMNTGVVTAEGRVVQAGRQVGVAEATLRGPDGRLHATASTTCLVFDTPAEKRA